MTEKWAAVAALPNRLRRLCLQLSHVSMILQSPLYYVRGDIATRFSQCMTDPVPFQAHARSNWSYPSLLQTVMSLPLVSHSVVMPILMFVVYF